MPELPNKLHERFAQHRANGLKQSESYERAGGSSDRSYAAKINARPEVVGRIAEIIAEREEQDDPADVSSMKGEAMLREAAKQAIRTRNLGALVAAAKEIAAYDGSGEALNPPDSHNMPVEVLAGQMVPTIRAIFYQLMPWQSVPSDERILAATIASLQDSFVVPAASATSVD